MTAIGGRLRDRAYEYILSQVVTGAYPLNARLPAEADLAERLGMSRPVIRAALRRLREDGLIASRRGSGSYVIRQPDKEVYRFAPVGSIADIQRCFVFRIAVEGEAAALAALERSDSDIERLRHTLVALEVVSQQGRVGVDEDIAFHAAVAKASGNHFFLSTLEALEDHIKVGINVNRNLSLIQPRQRLLTVQQEHEAIYAAIRERDAERARTTMRDHLERARRRIFEGGEG